MKTEPSLELDDQLGDGLAEAAAAPPGSSLPPGPPFGGVETAMGPPALAFTPENVPCLRLCRHYYHTVDHFDASNPGRRHVEHGHACSALPGVHLTFTADDPPYECNRWDPLQPHELGPLEYRRKQYYAANPDHVPAPLEDRLMVDLDDPSEDDLGNTSAAREYLELAELEDDGETGFPTDHSPFAQKMARLWADLSDDEREFVEWQLEGDDDGHRDSESGDQESEGCASESDGDRSEAGAREEHPAADGTAD